MSIKEEFRTKWARYFNGAELPIVFYYDEQESRGEIVPTEIQGDHLYELSQHWKPQ